MAAGTKGTATIGGTTAEVLPAAVAPRAWARISNTHATQGLFLAVGEAAVLNEGVYVGPGQSVELGRRAANIHISEAVNGIATGAGTVVAFMTDEE